MQSILVFFLVINQYSHLKEAHYSYKLHVIAAEGLNEEAPPSLYDA